MIPVNPSQGCVIVGNGTSVLDANHGPLIDQFETIVRFNRFEIQGFGLHIGSKTDILFTGLEAQHLGWRLALPYRRIYGHSWVKDPAKCPTMASFRNLLPSAPVEKVDHALRDEMAQCAGVDYTTWSTGAFAVWMLARQFPIVHLAGFDWWNRAEQHYFNPKANRGTLHKPEIEKVLIDRMQAEGRVAFL